MRNLFVLTVVAFASLGCAMEVRTFTHDQFERRKSVSIQRAFGDSPQDNATPGVIEVHNKQLWIKPKPGGSEVPR